MAAYGFCFAMIKHDALALDAEQPILDRLTAAGFAVVARKDTKLTATQIDTIYQEINVPKNDYFYPCMRSSLVEQPAVCLILTGPTDAFRKLRKLKGDSFKPGTIRGDYSYRNKMSDTEFDKWRRGEYDPVTSQWIHDQLYMHDKFHSSESSDDAIRSIKAIFSGAGLIETSRLSPELMEQVA